MKNNTLAGIIAGIAFAFAIILGGLPGFLWMLLFSALGAVIGAHFDGRLDLTSLFNGSGRGNRG